MPLEKSHRSWNCRRLESSLSIEICQEIRSFKDLSWCAMRWKPDRWPISARLFISCLSGVAWTQSCDTVSLYMVFYCILKGSLLCFWFFWRIWQQLYWWKKVEVPRNPFMQIAKSASRNWLIFGYLVPMLDCGSVISMSPLVCGLMCKCGCVWDIFGRGIRKGQGI